MRVAVTGATGTIGTALVRTLRARGDEVVALSRDPRRARSRLGAGVEAMAWTHPKLEPAPLEALSGADAVVNLLGEPLDKRWTDEAKHEIRGSRVLGTRNLVEGLRLASPAPRVLVSQSATGWYGARGEEPVDESTPAARDFLAQVTVDWEQEARAVEDLGVRAALTRTGVVLSTAGGALKRMLPPFRLGLGGPVAGGAQYVPWIHVDDVVGALVLCLESAEARGPINVCAPNPVTNRELSRTLGRVLRRPALIPVPGAALTLAFGEMAQVVTTGVRVMPKRLEELGYEFEHPSLEPALRSLLRR